MTKAVVFDSGVGGLSVVAHIRALLPDLHLDYVADDAFRPYGEKSAQALKGRLPGLLRTLELMLSPDMIVLACNTASTTALEEIRAEVRCPVIGVVPAIKPAARSSRSQTIAVLGTPGTVRRKYVQGLIDEFAPDCQIILHGSTALVALAEQKLSGQRIDKREIAAELAPLLAQDTHNRLDTIVLACTHFPLLMDELQAGVNKKVNWIESGPAIARRVQDIQKTITPSPDREGADKHRPQTAFCIGGHPDAGRKHMFARYGFEKMVCL
ncbi:MAG TPA: glutamate racemase [Hellea balneolensis]|uniref:Glutamate racemase n=1 Tax=Hellea balneolensis TaxID=287478 RepID=A0A7V5U1K3_9PROT|nr:glutamate racemase [Hellea balneolensis]